MIGFKYVFCNTTSFDIFSFDVFPFYIFLFDIFLLFFRYFPFRCFSFRRFPPNPNLAGAHQFEVDSSNLTWTTLNVSKFYIYLFLGALCYAEIGVVIPLSGAELPYLREGMMHLLYKKLMLIRRDSYSNIHSHSIYPNNDTIT